MIAQETRSAVKDSLAMELPARMKDSLGDILQTLLYEAQSDIWSVLYDIVQEFVMDLQLKTDTEGALKDQIA